VTLDRSSPTAPPLSSPGASRHFPGAFSAGEEPVGSYPSRPLPGPAARASARLWPPRGGIKSLG
jgi:hypothetical protein